jgi:uncharacterized RDD family membrane protein YckC
VSQIPAGWYPDPAPQPPGQPPTQRFWDGWAWTGHVAPVAWSPYAVPMPTGPTTPDGVPLAGWLKRAGAYLIDSLAIGTVSTLLTLPLQLEMSQDMVEIMEELEAETADPQTTPDFGAFFSDYLDTMQPLLIWSAVITLALWGIYNAVMLRWKRATLGKMVLGLEVRLRDRPGTLPWSSIAARVLVQHGVALAAVVPLLYLALVWFPWLDGLWPLWDRKRQALHDKAARTNVIEVR